MMTTLDDILETFQLLDDWEDRYSYIISLGRNLPVLNDADKSAKTRVSGCASQVWIAYDLTKNNQRDVLVFRAASDAILVSGLIAVLLTIYNDRTPKEILQIDADAIFAKLGLSQQLTAQRANGLRSMVERVRAIAQQYVTP